MPCKLSNVPLVNAAPRGTIIFDRDVAGRFDFAAGCAGLVLPADLRALADDLATFLALRFAGIVGTSIEFQASVIAETAVRLSLLVAFLRARLNGSNIWPHIWSEGENSIVKTSSR